ncbi:STAS domain-containing protein [Cesiribacter andamanensis]|uniref:Stressosome protein rsbRA n=1 Tax=Cesiribacter andamanensis AMV16 TaxID=1279009 RepID=M7NSM5_9BACT|nr:STAS domain-containing protein [Cesiribacter andamanensis]EMR01494.1 Stressosome protein rsbRA [Cesiribacter andamanensis AMV16]
MASKTSDILNKRKKLVLETWINNQLQDPTLREDLMTNQELHGQSEELLDSFNQAIRSGNYTDIDSQEYYPVLDILNSLSVTRAHAGFSPRETATFVLSLKRAIVEVLQQELAQDQALLISEILKISDLLDSLSISTLEAFIKGREEVILRQTNEINEISTPVIRVWEGILALPIIGTLDSERTQIIMENLLQEIVNTSSNIAILDISGVPTVDTLVAQHLIKTVSAARLMGAECIISGIRPEIAQTIVHLGIDLLGVQTKASLAAALQTAFSRQQLSVVKAKAKP